MEYNISNPDLNCKKIKFGLVEGTGGGVPWLSQTFSDLCEISVMPGWKKKVLFCPIEMFFKQDWQNLPFLKTENSQVEIRKYLSQSNKRHSKKLANQRKSCFYKL